MMSMTPFAAGKTVDDNNTPTIFVEGLPPLICEDGMPCLTPDRGEGPWLAYSPDRDHNGMDDRLQRVLAGEYPSVSPTAIVGSDGHLTVAINVDYSKHPDGDDVAALKTILNNHNWNEEGAWFDVLRSIHTISLDHVPLSALLEIWRLDGVVTVEQQNVMIPFLDKSVPSMKVSDSDVYEDTAHALGYRGDNVVVAVLDTGVDNEHRSLNDFDDSNDDPDLDATSYVDPKWVAGYDATSAFSNQSGTDDPDDSNGHGTHVASTSIGTGSSDRQFIGVAPGSYLVDVKVLTDAGGTNAQNTLRGLQWATDNVDTDWGNNGSSNGIDILSMSYGSVSNPNSDDPGDNGTSAESQLVNQATAAGLICVIAMGNDGMRRVPSPASADSSIAIGASDDRDTYDRTDDTIASYSNWGPREDDGDDDDDDELKPDVVAPGSGIHAAQNAAGSLQMPGQPRPMAENDYTSMDGTSMATPHVSGLIAIMLGIDEDLDVDDVRELLRENSEVRGSPYDTDIDPVWNEKWGFGIVDSERLVANLTGNPGSGGGGGGGNNSTEPPPSGSGDWVEIESPVSGAWLIEGETYRIRGIAESDTNGASIEEVLVRAWYWYQEQGSPREKRDAFDWTQAVGTNNGWNHTFYAQDWVDGEELTFEVKARDSTNAWSDTESLDVWLGSQSISIGSPSGQEPVDGLTTISGTFLTPNPIAVQWRIDREPWQEIAVSSSQEYTSVDWNVNWDTTQVDDGFHTMKIQGRDQSGVLSDEVRRTIEVDNYPPAPDLSIFGSISVEEYGISVDEAYVNTFLEIHVDVRNNGDADAENVVVHLREEGSKRSEATISRLGPGQVTEVILYWNPMASGSQNLEVIIDPGQSINEPDRSDNSDTITFPVIQRPDGVDLTIRPGAVTTSPAVPRPGESYTISIRVDNLGSHDSVNVAIQLLVRNEMGLYEDHGVVNAASITGQSSSSINFFILANLSLDRAVSYRVQLQTATDLDQSNNQADFIVVQDKITLMGSRTPALPSSHQIITSSGLGEDILIFTSKGTSLYVHKMGVDQSIYTCLEMETEWSGDLAVNSHREIVTVGWTRSYLDENNFIRSTVAYTTIDSTCQMTPRQDLMPGLLSAEGTYWGLGLDQTGDQVVLSGYHRDMLTGGTYQDTTSIFLLETESPLSSEDWTLTRNVVMDIEMYPRSAPSIDVEIGRDQIHILYQNIRDDSTGEERLGLFYSHGQLESQNWAFTIAVADYATIGEMILIEDSDDNEILITAWREGDGAHSELVTRVSPPSWFNGLEKRTPARGLAHIELLECERGIQILFDATSPTGPKIHYGLLSDEEGTAEMSLSDTLNSGALVTASRADDVGELHVFYITSSQGSRVLRIIEDSESTPGGGGILEDIRLQLGLDENTFENLKKTVGITCGMLSLFLLYVGVVARANKRKQSHQSTEPEFINENWVDLDDSDSDGDEIEITPTVSLEGESGVLVSIESEEPALISAELEPELETEDGIQESSRGDRASRRERRAAEAEMKKAVDEMHRAIEDAGLPPLPSPDELPTLPNPSELPPLPGPGELPPLPVLGELPPLPSPGELPPLPAPDELPPLPDLPAPELPVTCSSCEASFTARANAARRVKCPFCNETVKL
ncbi:MAG: S8 family serine peptidase [Candidatus Thalassarchaeaceae archaeon]|nr:S8 family serine peptidase [Candidatus Thalassarchaeaceae archaeon]